MEVFLSQKIGMPNLTDSSIYFIGSSTPSHFSTFARIKISRFRSFKCLIGKLTWKQNISSFYFLSISTILTATWLQDKSQLT